MKHSRFTHSTRVWLAVASVIASLVLPSQVQAICDQYSCNKDTQTEDDYLACNKDKQVCLEKKINETKSEAITLNNTISILNGQIQVQQLKIDQTIAQISKLEKEVSDLSTRISGLEISLDKLSRLLVERISASYKKQASSPLALLLVSDSLNDFLTQYRYLQIAQNHIGGVMQKAETQRLTYDEQKSLKEVKQTEVEQQRSQLSAQQAGLTTQRSEQQQLLTQTKNNEAIYRKELEKTLAELQAIQSIIAGRGDESKVGDVSAGDKIASIIAGSSTCSTGSHLHFEVVKDGTHRDPAGYLKPIDVLWSNSPDGSFSLVGNWEWPVDNAARVTQGYGMTYYARVYRAYGGSPHTGIDMFSKTSGDYDVKAVRDGTLFRGSIRCGGGLLRYVRVDHSGDEYSTYYLHVNY